MGSCYFLFPYIYPTRLIPMMRRFSFFLVLFLCASNLVAQNTQLIERLKSKAKQEQGLNRVNILNDLVDEMLLPKPTEVNCTSAEKYANDAAELSEKLNYDLGKARSFEQLTVIYKTLNKRIQYLKWKSKAGKVPYGPAMKQQQAELNSQREELEKLGLKIEDQSIELQEKSSALDSTAEKVEQLSMEKKVVLLENTVLQNEGRIKEIEVAKQRQKSQLLAIILTVFLLLTAVLYFLFQSRKKLANELVQKNKTIESEKKRSEELLLNILPLETANELKTTGKAEPKNYKRVSIMFTDFKDFTGIAEKLSPKELVTEIDYCFSAFDEITSKYEIEKIKTIGDAYLCAFGMGKESSNHSAIIQAAQEILAFMERYKSEREAQGKEGFSIRIGIHTGAVVAGVVGKHKFAYDIWGDAVNTAARMEQSSEAGRINISADTYELVKDDFTFESRGKVMAKNKGKIDMYFVN